jgi:hypothetical protein
LNREGHQLKFGQNHLGIRRTRSCCRHRQIRQKVESRRLQMAGGVIILITAGVISRRQENPDRKKSND